MDYLSDRYGFIDKYRYRDHNVATTIDRIGFFFLLSFLTAAEHGFTISSIADKR